jgi:hypothetical protein
VIIEVLKRMTTSKAGGAMMPATCSKRARSRSALGSALAVLLEQARRRTMRVWAEQSPFELKDALKRRGYRWYDGSDGRPKSWYVDIDESKLEQAG